jgi:hypothetical protein
VPSSAPGVQGVGLSPPTCRLGHVKLGENLRVLSSGERRCKQCEAIRHKRYRQRRREQGLPRSPKQQSNREMYWRRHLRREIALLIEEYDGDGDIADLLPALAERLHLQLSTCRFELGWQMGMYDLAEEERSDTVP